MMSEHLQDFLKEIPQLLKIISAHQPLCLLFNYDELAKSCKVNGMMIIEKLFSLTHYPRLFCGIVSRKSLAELHSIPASEKFILAGSLGLEIDSPIFGWHYPQLAFLRYHLDKIYTALELELGPNWIREHTMRYGTELKINFPPAETATRQRSIRTIKDSANALPLKIIQTQAAVRVILAAEWEKSNCVEKIFSLLPRESGQVPILCYFGAEISDESAFRQANLYGYSILMRENIGRQTQANYYLRNLTELNKLLTCLGS
jgi:hypothetical protein